MRKKSRHGSIAVAVMIVILAVACTTGAAIAKPDCHSSQDFAQIQRCFLGSFPCIGLYFGIDQSRDYPGALKCFESSDQVEFTVLMYINGEGVPRDLQKAEALLKNGEKTESDYVLPPEMAAVLHKAIDRCNLAPHESCPRVDFCQSLAYKTQEIEMCLVLDQLPDEAQLSRTIAEVREKLSGPDRAIFDRAVAEFKAYQFQERRRADDYVLPGREAGLAAWSQADWVGSNFLKLIVETIQTRKLKPASVAEYKAADDSLARVYSSDFRKNVTERRKSMDKDDESEKMIVEDSGKSARESQEHWQRLRDLLAALANSLYRNQAKSFDPATSMKTAITKIRIEELSSEPSTGS
jgi:hypothetical protein